MNNEELKVQAAMKRYNTIVIIVLSMIMVVSIVLVGMFLWHTVHRSTRSGLYPPGVKKPVIYLYPEEKTNVDVALLANITCVYPAFDEDTIWHVTAEPDGTLFDRDGKQYNYLYWEGVSNADWDFSKGFCVAGQDVASFLEISLEKLGLTRKEANEFIVYWLPQMERNEWNVISFQTDAYTDGAELVVDPEPDSVIRVFMAWYASDSYVEMEAQNLVTPLRTGFTVVEWGGAEVK